MLHLFEHRCSGDLAVLSGGSFRQVFTVQYSNRSRGTRRLAEQEHDTSASIVIDESAVTTRRRAKLARPIQDIYEIGPFA